jgi:radical SAM protein with 4Fe4S-binding SPASM domain
MYFVNELTASSHKDAHCNLGVDTITIAADGIVYPCYMFIGQQDLQMADIGDPAGLATDRFATVQKRFLDNRKSTNPICAACSILNTCHTCPGAMTNNSGSLSTPVPMLCDYLVGYAEGMLLGLNEARLCEDTWNAFLDSFVSPSDLDMPLNASPTGQLV